MMPSSWKWKVWALAFLTVLSIYLLVPTLMGFSAIKEQADIDGKTVPWYFSVFTSKGINLGLDLRGGIYLEFEVEMGRAIENKVDAIISDLTRSFERDKITHGDIAQDVKSHSISIAGLTPETAGPVQDYVDKNYGEVLAKIVSSSKDSLTYKPVDAYIDRLKDTIIKQALEKVRTRIDKYGVSEPTIQRLGSDRIAVELPGLKDPDRAIGIIKQAGQLEFKLVDESLDIAKLTEMISEVRKKNELAEDYTSKGVERLNELLRDKLPKDTEIAFENRYDPVSKKITGAEVYLLQRKADVTGEMLKDAMVAVNNNDPYVALTFDAQGAVVFGELTSKNIGKKLAILLDGNVNKAPVIRSAIMGGQAEITLGSGNYEALQKEAEDLVLVLREGALPAQLIEATKTVVGPSLGADSIKAGVLATFIGSIAVVIFMIVYYKRAGVIANMALVLNFILIMAAMALFQATLTLPGIAGIALTLGMAVDANVLINERMREERRAGKTPKAIVDAGYNNAMRAIIDSNLTTLIAGVVLYQYGTGPIRGFAVTLMIGLTISMYTACVCTRMYYDWALIKRNVQKLSI